MGTKKTPTKHTNHHHGELLPHLVARIWNISPIQPKPDAGESCFSILLFKITTLYWSIFQAYCNSSVGWLRKVILCYQTEGVSTQSYLQLDVRLDSHMVLQQLLFQLTWERRCQNLMPTHFYWNWIEKSVQLTASSWRQISKSSWLYICISIRIFQLMWNICDCFFSLCSLSYYSSSACQEVLQLCVWAISSSFYFGHKSSKASIRPKSFNCPISYPTTNPTYLPWLITKSSRFIHSTSCGGQSDSCKSIK